MSQPASNTKGQGRKNLGHEELELVREGPVPEVVNKTCTKRFTVTPCEILVNKTCQGQRLRPMKRLAEAGMERKGDSHMRGEGAGRETEGGGEGGWLGGRTGVR